MTLPYAAKTVEVADAVADCLARIANQRRAISGIVAELDTDYAAELATRDVYAVLYRALYDADRALRYQYDLRSTSTLPVWAVDRPEE